MGWWWWEVGAAEGAGRGRGREGGRGGMVVVGGWGGGGCWEGQGVGGREGWGGGGGGRVGRRRVLGGGGGGREGWDGGGGRLGRRRVLGGGGGDVVHLIEEVGRTTRQRKTQRRRTAGEWGQGLGKWNRGRPDGAGRRGRGEGCDGGTEQGRSMMVWKDGRRRDARGAGEGLRHVF